MKRRPQRTRTQASPNAGSGQPAHPPGRAPAALTAPNDRQLAVSLVDAMQAWMAADPANRTLAIALAEVLLNGVKQHPQLTQHSLNPPSELPNTRDWIDPQLNDTILHAMAGFESIRPTPAPRAAAAPSITSPVETLGPAARPTHATTHAATAASTATGIGPRLPPLFHATHDARSSKQSGLVGGIDGAPASAKGLEVVAAKTKPARSTHKPPHKPAHKLSTADPGITGITGLPGTPGNPGTDAQGQRPEQLLLQRIEHHKIRLQRCAQQRDMPAAGQHLSKLIDSFEEYAARFGPMRGPASEAVAATIDALPTRLELSSRDDTRFLTLLSAMDAQDEGADEPATSPSPAALARPLLTGRIAILVGGNRRDVRREALVRDLGLGELRWLYSTPSKPSTGFEADIKRPEVGLVLLAIRWVRHATAWAVAEAALKHGKPLVRLPGGLGSNAVAHEVLEQVKRQLQAL